MLYSEEQKKSRRMTGGEFGLEKENLRICPDGYPAKTPHPFPQEDPHISRDFCENQPEIATDVFPTPEGAVENLLYYTEKIRKKLADAGELLWPFSNPPYLPAGKEIPIARFTGRMAEKTVYRRYLSEKYGRRIMTFCGMHVNFSFSDQWLQADFDRRQEKDFQEYKNRLYLNLAEQLVRYGWVLVSLTAASPLLDASFEDEGRAGQDLIKGYASVRCSREGYWNTFAPILSYDSVRSYADSIQKYLDDGRLISTAELYYPIRLKPAGNYSLQALREKGISHIELRMVDLNPLQPSGIDVRDLHFAELLLCWLAAFPRRPITEREQLQAVENYKNAALLDLSKAEICLQDEKKRPAKEALSDLLSQMEQAYGGQSRALETLRFEREKLQPGGSYAEQVLREFSGGYVRKGLELARKRQIPGA